MNMIRLLAQLPGSRRRVWRMAPVLLSLLLVACGGLDGGQLTPFLGTPPVTGATPSAAASDETPILMCTPPACAPGEEYACPTGDCPGGCGTVCATPATRGEPTPITGPLAAAPTDWENLEGWLTALWKGNVNPAAVRAALQQSGMQRGYDDWRAADFDGDLQDEWVLVLYDPSLPSVPFGSPGDLWIVNGEGVVFRHYPAPSSDIYEFMAPTIVDLADLTGDGLPELIVDAHLCGAHTCYGNYRIIGQTATGLGDRISRPVVGEGDAGNTINISYPDTRVEDTDGDGIREFIVHGGTIGSAGAGIVRPLTQVWKWDGAAITLASTTLDPTGYRHHILYEANDRMAAGDLDGALALYEAAINDGALRNDAFAYPPEQTYADISRFAAFRLILIDLMQGNAERAAGRLAWLRENHPDTAAAGAASLLIDGWTGPEGQAALCESIEAGLAGFAAPTGGLVDMGYGNPSLTAADFCP